MKNKKKQYYVVVKGNRPGVYNKWFGSGGAAEQVQGFQGAVYKGFYTAEEAVIWLGEFSEAELPETLLDWLSTAEESLPKGESPEEILAAGKVLIYTDGGADPNPGPGGYGVVLRYQQHRKELSGGFRLTTNNRMELLACIQALSALKRSSDVILYSDSKYVVRGIMEGWAARWRANGWKRRQGQDVENADLWERLLVLCEQHNVEFRWVRGHAGNPDNERCDQLATQAMLAPSLPLDPGYTES